MSPSSSSSSDEDRRVLTDALALVKEAFRQDAALEDLLGTIIESAISLSGSQIGYLYLLDDDRIILGKARISDGESFQPAENEMSKTILRQVLDEDRSLCLGDAISETGAKSVIGFDVRSVLCVPIRSMGELIGGLYLEDRNRKNAFSRSHQNLIEVFSEQVGMAVESTKSISRFKRENVRIESAILELRKIVKDRYSAQGLIGRSHAMEDVYEFIDRMKDETIPVLITGESGTGKERVARALHASSKRMKGPLEAINCAAIPENLIESELFGYRKGAFTEAHSDKSGLFEIASGGTLFIDEVGEMSPAMQSKLLRVLQEGVVRPLGGESEVPFDARIISATNARLVGLIREGAFREDLYFRLCGAEIELPPLRERLDDLPLLIEHFLEIYDGGYDRPVRRLSRDSYRLMNGHSWPGNVRELESVVQQAVALRPEGVLDRHVLEKCISKRGPVSKGASHQGNPYKGKTLAEIEREAIVMHLTLQIENSGKINKAEAARALGVSRNTVNKKIEDHGIEIGQLLE